MRRVALLMLLLLLVPAAVAQNGTGNGTDDGAGDDGNTTQEPVPDGDPLFGRNTVTAGAWIGVALVLGVAAFLYGRNL